nr:MAG TPA: hypothetical protein [Caudoviricetes sp.]
MPHSSVFFYFLRFVCNFPFIFSRFPLAKPIKIE